MSGRLLNFADLLAEVPIGKTALRALLARLGFRRSASCGKLLFTAEQVEAIKGAAACRTGFMRRAPERATGTGSHGSGYGAASTNSSAKRMAARSRTRALRSASQSASKRRPGDKVVPLR
jgi:hypothetical protein